MNRIVLVLLSLLAVAAAPPAVTTVPSTPAAPTFPEEQERVAGMLAKMLAGNVDEALQAAQGFVGKARDESAKTEALRIIAECLRKKGDWRGAAGAYTRLRERYDKNSDDYAKNDAIAEILQASPKGVYPGPGVVASPGAPPEGTKTLSDDAVLAEALKKLAAYRLARLKSKALQMKRGRSPQEVAAAFALVAAEAKQSLALAPDAPADGAREVARAAADRLQELSTQIGAPLRGKLQKYTPKMSSPWSFTNIEKKDISDTNAACKQMSDGEKNFQESLQQVAGAGWPDGDRLRSESTDRRAAYDQLAEQFIVPRYTTMWY